MTAPAGLRADAAERIDDSFESVLGSRRGGGRPADAPAAAGMVPSLPATVSSDDGNVEESFDALPYVRALSDADLRTLVEVERGGHADDANDIAGTMVLTGDLATLESAVRRIAAYVDLDNPNAAGWLEVRLDRGALAEYVRIERPQLQLDLAALDNEDIW